MCIGEIKVTMATPVSAANRKAPATWFILVSGGEQRSEAESNTRKEFKKICKTILEQNLAERDHIVFLSGGQGKLSIDPILRHSYEGSTAATLSTFLDCTDETGTLTSSSGYVL